MSAHEVDRLIAALALPESTRVDQHVPKKLLAEQDVATAADRRLVQDGVDEIVWLATLKPHLVGVPAFEDAQRHYAELAVLHLSLKAGAKPARLVQLLHRAVPYPVLLFTTSDAGIGISMAHLRTSQTEAGKTVLDGELLTVGLAQQSSPECGQDTAFRTSLALAQQPQSDLYALYQGWIDTIDALDIAHETGSFRASLTREHAATRHAALHSYRQLKVQISNLRTLAERERQIARQVALNHEIQAAQHQLQTLRSTLAGEAA
jgi:hypothetical protein